MKHLLIIVSMFLLVACQTMQPVEPKIEISSHVEKKERPKYFETDKPMACVESGLALAKLKDEAGEIPYAVWYDTTKNFRVLMMINKKAKTVTIMEYVPTPSEFAGTGDTQFVCFLSMGFELYINKKVETTNVSFGKEN